MLAILALFGLLAEATRIGVVVVPPASQNRLVGRPFSQRLIRRLEEFSGVSAQELDPQFLTRDSETLEMEAALIRFRSNPTSASEAFHLGRLTDSHASTRTASALVQSSALALAAFHRKDLDNMRWWLDVALKIHPRLELSPSIEWDALTQYPEVALQVDATRKKLWRECNLFFADSNGLMNISLNGFLWKRGEKLAHRGPFWLKATSPKGVFERWVTCEREPVVVIAHAAVLAPSRTVPLIARSGVDALIVAWGEGPIRLAEVASDGTVILIDPIPGTLESATEMLATGIPFEIHGKIPSVLAEKKHTEEKNRWYSSAKPWWWLGTAVLGLAAVKMTGFTDSSTRIEGTVE